MKSLKTIVGCLFLTWVMCGAAFPNNPTYLINSVTHVLGSSYNNMNGLCFTLNTTIDDYQGKEVIAYGVLQHKDSNGEWKDVPFSKNSSNVYSNAKNIVRAKAKTGLSCCCQSSNTSKYEVFLPYNAITHPSGNVDYKIMFWMGDAKEAGKFIPNKKGGYYHNYYFSLNWPTAVQTLAYDIKNVSHVLGNQYNNMTGLCFNLSAVIDNYQGKEVLACGKLCYKNSNGEWKDVPFSKDASYDYVCVGDAVMAKAKTTLSCCCQNSSTSKYEVFLPYNAITHPSGNVDYKIIFWLRDAKDAGKFIPNKKGGYYHEYTFSLNWPQEKKVKNTSSVASNQNNGGNGQPRHVHTPLANGGYIDTYYYDNGTSKVVTSNPCPYCYGGGICPHCHGQGQTFSVAGAYSRWIPCYICHQTGRCQQCGGTGTMQMVTWVNNNTGQYGTVTNGGHVFSGYATDGSSSSSSSSSSSKSSSNDDYYIEEIVYAPNYTGSDEVWCDKCKKYGPRHSHVKKRVR